MGPISNNFIKIYNKACRLANALFAVSNLIKDEPELKDRIKALALEVVATSVNLKDLNKNEVKPVLLSIEKNVLLMMSLTDIAAVSGLISEMNGRILKEEFQAFIFVAKNFYETFENEHTSLIKSALNDDVATPISEVNQSLIVSSVKTTLPAPMNRVAGLNNSSVNNHSLKRKDTRKSTILNFIKSHNNVSIKDILPHIIGCSEKTVQRELLELINEGLVTKMGQRRWSRYSIK